MKNSYKDKNGRRKYSIPMSVFDPNAFRADEEKDTIRKTPTRVLDLPSATPGRRDLTDEQWNAAEKDLIQKEFVKLEYPRTMKLQVDPPLAGQYYGLVSFIPAKDAVPDKDGLYGVLKLRGNFANMKEADAWSENLIRNHDSYATIDFCYVGKSVPLMKDNTLYTSSTREIDIRRKVDETTREDVKKKREAEKQEMLEVQERHRNLMSSVDEEKEKVYEDLDLYTQLRTKRAHLKMTQDECAKKMKETSKLISQCNTEITDLDEKHPEYKDEFMDRYKAALDTVGADISTNPLVKYME